MNTDLQIEPGWSRRKFVKVSAMGAATGALIYAGYDKTGQYLEGDRRASVFVGKASDYSKPLESILLDGMRALGCPEAVIRGKRILLKPNFVEPHQERAHIATHPMLIRAAVDVFLALGAQEVVVAEGAGHHRDTVLILEATGMADVLREDKIRFVDLNYQDTVTVVNAGGNTKARTFEVPKILREFDWIVSMPKMKTHHWAGLTLSMKNMFGTMPGSVYGWPKNIFHYLGIDNSIIDLNSTIRPHFAIVDGIIGMEGDGPIMGTAKHAGVVVMGANLTAVDATCARLMGVNPAKVQHLKMASGILGPIRESHIEQRGEKIRDVAVNFELLQKVPAQRGIRL